MFMLGVETEIDIQKTTQLLRTQRSGMVQTEVKFQFIENTYLRNFEVQFSQATFL